MPVAELRRIRRSEPSRPLRGMVLTVAATALLAGLGAAAGSARPAWQPSSSVPSALLRAPAGQELPKGQGSLAVGTRQLDSMLTRRAKAIMIGDRKLFLADILPTEKSFIQAQSGLFASLQDVPLSSFSYETVAGEELEVPAVAAKWGESGHVIPVRSRHTFKDYQNERPAAYPQAFTVALVNGRWWIVGDQDAKEQLPQAQLGSPWDAGRVYTAVGQRSIVLGYAEDRPRLRNLTRRVDAAAARVSAVWGLDRPGHPPRRVVVQVSAADQIRDSYFKSETGPPPDAVTDWTTRDFAWFESQAPTSATYARAGQVILLNGPLGRGGDALLRHEVAHALLGPAEGAGTPTWLVEGMAEYTAFRRVKPNAPLSMRSIVFDRGIEIKVTDALNARKYRLAWPENQTEFYQGTTDEVAERYANSLFLCAYIANHWSEAKLRALELALGKITDPAQTTEQSAVYLKQVLGVTPAQLLADAHAWVNREYHLAAGF